MVRSLAGHARLDTASRYLHAEADELHMQVSQALKTRQVLKHKSPAVVPGTRIRP